MHIERNRHFEEIYHANVKAVYNLALQYVQNTEDAAEITQDVFVSVHESLEKFRSEAKVSTWIYRIAINKSLDFIKSKKRKKRFAFFTSLFYDNGTEINHNYNNFNHPGVQLENKESLKKLMQWIDELPDNQKTVIILSKMEQKSQAEIAEIMALHIKAVESLMHRAKQNLLKKINNSEG
jgi:RNA polymerase sigma factor (sigma-70 family)